MDGPGIVNLYYTNRHIYVADTSKFRIEIYSQAGNYINHFGIHLNLPWGVLIHQDSGARITCRKYILPKIHIAIAIVQNNSDDNISNLIITSAFRLRATLYLLGLNIISSIVLAASKKKYQCYGYG